MGKTVLESGSPSNFFLDQLHQSGLSDRDIDGAVADDAVGGPGIGVCKVGADKDGKVGKGEIFAVAFNNLVKHGETIKRYFQKLDLKEVEHLQPDGQFAAPYRETVKQELLGKDPQRSLRAWPNPKKLSPQDAGYAASLVQWARTNTRLPLLPYKEQVAVLKELGLEEAQVKGELGKLWKGQTLPKMMAHASVLRGEELLRDARAKRGVGDVKEAQGLEMAARRLFRTAVEMDGDNPAARRRLAEALEAGGRYREAGLHYAQALRTEPDFEVILQILDRLSGPKSDEMIGKSPDAFSFVGFALKDAGRFPEAALIFQRAAVAATGAGEHKKSLAFTEQELLAQEATTPYVAAFSAESNPVATALYKTLRDAGIPSASIDRAPEVGVPDRKITAAEVFGYLDANLDDPRVKKALDKIQFNIPWLDGKGRLKKEFDTPEFTKLSLAGRMAHWHAGEAVKLPASEANDVVIEKHLRMASYFEPESAGRHSALGEFYLARKDPAKAKTAFLAAVAADPGKIDLQLPLAKALAGSGDFKGALEAYDKYLKQHPEDAATKALRATAHRGYQGTLRDQFDGEMLRFQSLAQANPTEAMKSLKTLEGMAKELTATTSEEPLDRLQNLKRAQSFYNLVRSFETAHEHYDRDTIFKAESEIYDGITAAFKEVRESLKLAEGASPTRAQIERAQGFLALQMEAKGEFRRAGMFEDLRTLALLVRDVPSDVMSEQERLAAFDGVLASYGQLRKLYGTRVNDREGEMAHAMHELGGNILDAQFGMKDSPEKKLAAELLARVIDDGNTKLLPFFSMAGVKEYVAQSAEADQGFYAALKVGDVREQRGALLLALGQFAKLQDEKRVEQALEKIRGTIDDKMTDSDKLQIETAAWLALRGSGLPQEKTLLEGSKLRAFKMAFVSDTSSPGADVKRLLLLKSYYETVGDAAGAKMINAGLDKTRDSLLNYLHFGKPDQGIKKPTDSKERLELAALSVQIDQALLGEDIAGTMGKLSIESRTGLYTSRLEIWRKELAKATNLPYADRLEQGRLLAQSAAVYRSLTEGEGAFLDKKKVDDQIAAIEKEINPLLEEYFAQDADASPAQKALADKITQDLKDRFHTAMEKGDSAWLSGALTTESLLQFGEQSQNGHVLLAEAATQRGPRGVELRLKATATFINLGLTGRVKESLGPVEEYAAKLGNPKQKVGLLLTITQGYQQAGLKKEANDILQKVIDMDAPGAAPEIKEFAVLAKGMQHLNNGEVSKAQETLAAIPNNPNAKLLLAQLAEGTEQRRLRMTIDALAPTLFSIYQGRKTELSDAEADEIRGKVQATLEKWQKQLANGEIQSLDDAFRNDMGGFYHESFEGEMTKGFIRRISNPNMTDEEFGRSLLRYSQGMLKAEKYAAAMGIAQLFEKDPVLGAEAKEILAGIPGQARLDGILKSLKNMTIIFAESDEEALKSAAIMLVSFGVGRFLAVGAEAAWVARAATFIRSPILLRTSTFAVKTTAEAAGFTLGSMTMETIWSGKTNHWNMKHFGTEFGSMLVTFVLLHGVGMGMQGFSAASARYVGRAEAGMARALESGGGLGAAAFEVRLANGIHGVAKSGITAWGSRILAFTGTEYVNEAIGLRPKENIPFWIRLAGSAITDAQMMGAAKGLDVVSRGRVSKLEKATQMKLAQHKMNYQAKELMPVVERMGFDPNSPVGRAVWEGLLGSRAQGESLKAIEGRTGAEEMARYEKIVAETLGLDPKSPEGQGAKAALMGYAQVHPFASPGKPLRATELAEITGKLDGAAAKLLTEAGLERGPGFESMRLGLMTFALQTGLEPGQLGEYAGHAKGLKAPLKTIANQILGPDAAKTPEGQTLMGELAVYAMFRASAPDKLAEPLKELGSPEWGAELHGVLRARAEALLGKGGEETPAGRAWMAKLFLRALHESGQTSEVLPGLKSLEAGGEFLPMLADVVGFNHPKQRLALATWALEQGISPEVANGMVYMVLSGRIELRVEGDRFTALKIPEAEQAAKAAEVLKRLPELPAEALREDRAAVRRAEEEILTVTDDMIIPLEPLQPKVSGKDLGVATFLPMNAVVAMADKIAQAKPNAERLARYVEYIMKKDGITKAEAEVKAKAWAEQVILDARNNQIQKTHIYDTSVQARPETQHLDKATIDHHGRFKNLKNATEQFLDRLEMTLETVKSDPAALKAAKADKVAMKQANGDPVVAAALRELHLRQVTTDNLGDGAWCVWIAKNQARVLSDPALRKLIGEATRFEDNTAFGTEYNPKDPAVRLQAALFQKYGEILVRNEVKTGNDRFEPDKAEKVMAEAIAAIDKILADPAAREAAATEFFAKVEAGHKKAAEDALIPEASVHEGETNLSFFDLAKLGEYTIFQQWLALPRVEPKSGSPDTLQVSVKPMNPDTAADGTIVPRNQQIVAIPNGRELPSGKSLLTVLDRLNAAEKAKSEQLGVQPNTWFGKENVVLAGTVLTSKEISQILTSPELALFQPRDNVVPLKKVAEPTRNLRVKPTLPKETPPAGDATKPGFKIAARKGEALKPTDEAPVLTPTGPVPLSPKESVPPVEISHGGKRIPITFEGGQVLVLGEQGGKLQVGTEVKNSLAEVEVMRDTNGELAFYLRRSGEGGRQKLNPGDAVKVGEAEFAWEGPVKEKTPELKLVTPESTPEEKTQKYGLPGGGEPAPGIKGKVGLSTVEIAARAFLDFYFGENGSIKNIETLSGRSAPDARDIYADLATDFRRSVESFRTKVAKFDQLEKDFDRHTADFKAAEGKDPTKAKKSALLAEDALLERKALEIEIDRDLKKLQADPYNQIELFYNERIEQVGKETLALDFALATAQVQATIAVRGTNERPDLHYEYVFKPMTEFSDKHFDSEFSKLPLNELVHAEVSVTRWEAAERALDLMIEEGVLRPEQKPDIAALQASGAKEFAVDALILGAGEMKVVFQFEGKVEAKAEPKPEPKGPKGDKNAPTAAAMFLGLTTLLTPEIAHAGDKVAAGDGSILPWMLGAGAAIVAAGVGAYMLWAKGRSGGKGEIRQRRGTGTERIPDTKPLTEPPTKPELKQVPAAKPVVIPAAKPVVAPKVEPVAKQNQGPAPVPVKGPVKMALEDNVPGRGRQGKLSIATPTAEYGSFSVITNEGKDYGKPFVNEDGYVQGRNWALVLDGMGGMGGGDKASALAGKKFAEEMALHGDMVRAMIAGGDAVNQSPYRDGGAVAVAHQIVKMPDGSSMARIVHVGDAGAIVFRRNAQGEFEQVFRTEEQSIAAERRKAGIYHNTIEMRIDPQANVVLGGMGVGRKAEPVLNEVPLKQGDFILSFSDGVGDNVSRHEMADILKTSKSPEEVSTRINDLVHWKMGQLAKAKALAKGDGSLGTLLESRMEFDPLRGRQVPRWKVELADMPGYVINEQGHVSDRQGVVVDRYKADNVTIHVYSHDIAKPSKPSVAGDKTLVMPAPIRDTADVKTVVMQLPQPAKKNDGSFVLPKGFVAAFLGRDASKGAKLELAFPEISSQHAEFYEFEGRLYIEDRGSYNGTVVNGRRLQGEEKVALNVGDIVTFSTRSYQVSFSQANGEAVFTPALIISPVQKTLELGGVTFVHREGGVTSIQTEGTEMVKVEGKPLPADGNSYRIRDGESVQIGDTSYIFREFK